MSMISAQIDELRKAAEYYDGSEVASIMRYAADTIWQLRDDLQRANAAVQDAEHEESMAWDRVRKAEAENAKLRELALALADCRNTTCDDCVRWDYPDGGCSLDGVMRELRIEVDE